MWALGDVHDTFRWGVGLGLSTLKVAETLAKTGPATTRELSLALGLTDGAVRRHLRRLVDHGLAQGTEGVFTLTLENLDIAAEGLGAAGTGERQRERFRQDRIAFEALIPRIEATRRAHGRSGRQSRRLESESPVIDPPIGESAREPTGRG